MKHKHMQESIYTYIYTCIFYQIYYTFIQIYYTFIYIIYRSNQIKENTCLERQVNIKTSKLYSDKPQGITGQKYSIYSKYSRVGCLNSQCILGPVKRKKKLYVGGHSGIIPKRTHYRQLQKCLSLKFTNVSTDLKNESGEHDRNLDMVEDINLIESYGNVEIL
jgi:hypothetical protein